MKHEFTAIIERDGFLTTPNATSSRSIEAPCSASTPSPPRLLPETRRPVALPLDQPSDRSSGSGSPPHGDS